MNQEVVLSQLEDLNQLNDLLNEIENLEEVRPRKKIKRSCGVREINKTRNVNGYFKVTFLPMKEVDPDQFFIHTRMTKTIFQMLLELIGPQLKKSEKITINIECRLALTLLYLSQGCSIQALAWSWKMGKETVRLIILETCDAIWNIIGPLYVTEPSLEDYVTIERDFWDIWNLPNCVGALDGKHVAIQCPPGTGSQFFNYKNFFSIVLMATCDARYIFTNIDIGAYGSQSDGGIFNVSVFGKRICTEKLPIPPPKTLPETSTKLPHYFVGDAAFTLTKNFMKPYPGTDLTEAKQIFNKRLSRARRIIENSFGILVSRWRILLTTINMMPDNAEKVVLGCVALHNFLRLHKESSQLYVPSNYVDWEDFNHVVQNGLWRTEATQSLQSIIPSQHLHVLGGKTPLQIRDRLCSFVNNEGRLDWMWDK